MDQTKLMENKYWVARLTKEAMEEIPNLIGEDNSSKLGEIESRIADIQKALYGRKAPTVQSIVQEMYELTSATLNTQTMREPFTIEDVQGMFYMHIEVLSELLGVELKDD